jgi:hypothetical protein
VSISRFLPGASLQRKGHVFYITEPNFSHSSRRHAPRRKQSFVSPRWIAANTPAIRVRSAQGSGANP